MARRPKSNNVEHAMVRALDELSAFDEFQAEIAPALRGAVKSGKTPEQIFSLIMAHAAARQATIALTSKKPSEALAAIKDLLDRVQGKPTERKEIKLALENAPEDQIDARLKTLMAEAAATDEDTIQ